MTDSTLALYGTDLFGDPIVPTRNGPLAAKFLVPPFSVLNAREGWWQERKRAWLSLGIQSELGRADLFHSSEPAYSGDSSWAGVRGPKAYNTAEWVAEHSISGNASKISGTGTSIFDPVLCELCYRWFAPNGGLVVDPFAGGSVRGIVAALLDRNYWGCDLSAPQVAANRNQAEAICADRMPLWVCGDSLETIGSSPPSDLVFTCPPYGDLEVYSDDARDLSTMEYHTFIATFKRIMFAACSRLRQHRFACVVVGDFRDKVGHYRGFVADTIKAFAEWGMPLYNDAVLVTAVGSLPIRIDSQFRVNRKMGKTHQNVLVFVKGDWRKACAALGEVDCADEPRE